MKQLPIVTIVICTYDREVEIRRTIDSLVKNLKYPTDLLRFHIADDGSGGLYAQRAARYWYDAWDIGEMPTVTVTERKGWGANVNTALKTVSSDYVYFTEDDYVLKRRLDLESYVAAMEAAPSIGLLRFGIAGHSITAHLNEVDIRKWDPLFEETDGLLECGGYGGAGRMNIWVVDKQFSSGPFSFYLYSNRPHLKHRRFHETFGYYIEGQTLANTEHAMNHQFRQGPEMPFIVCPANWTGWHYDHIGVSRQGTSEDVHVT